ncbi:hypothetical protein OsI_00319 [Oryza sativa Indica Group]|uniref:Wall-associated receptor kinase galacturonan-binding domain-containing protein n=1 Tax=Oryza sativa subsp. indica TaxID=39946 RepID=B8AD61_ORYSI|nr:hypothetical protein OsI_00319 [Oryza sativa Indica Group]
MLLLITLPIASSTVDAINTTNTTSPFCEPARCGNLTIGYPFWLAGKHPPECGYRGFQVTCDHKNASLKNGFWTYQIQDIFYHNSSFMVTNEQLTDGQCVIESFVNASSDLGLTLFKISPINRELVFLYNCSQGRSQLPISWAPVGCAKNDSSNSYAWLAGKYKPDDDFRQLPGNCTVSMIPVLGYDGAVAKNYERLIKGGFLLEYTAGPDDCKTCTESGGQCRVNVTNDRLDCQCSNGVSPGMICGSKITGRRTILIVLPMHRPTITQVLDMFERSLDELEMPPKQNFSELLDHPVHELNTESTNYTRNTKSAQGLSEVLRVEETSLVNSNDPTVTTNHAKR